MNKPEKLPHGREPPQTNSGTCVITFNRGATIYQWRLGFKYWCRIWKEAPNVCNLHRPQNWTSAHRNSKTMRCFFGDNKKWKCNSCGCWCSESVNGMLSDSGESYRTAFASPPVRLRQSSCSCSRLTDLYEESQSCHTLHFFLFGFTDQKATKNLCFHIACCCTLTQPHAAFVCWGAEF